MGGVHRGRHPGHALQRNLKSLKTSPKYLALRKRNRNGGDGGGAGTWGVGACVTLG